MPFPLPGASLMPASPQKGIERSCLQPSETPAIDETKIACLACLFGIYFNQMKRLCIRSRKNILFRRKHAQARDTPNRRDCNDRSNKLWRCGYFPG